MSKKSELFNAFAQFGRERRVSLRDPKALEAFTTHVTEEIEAAVASDARLHGHRTQNMFEALIVSLGEYKLLKVEDAGRAYFKGAFKVPDFMIVLEDDRRWVIEVKNVYEKDPFRQETTLKRDYVQALRGYAQAVGCELKFAVYWARWGLWTVISVDDLDDDGSRLSTNMQRAMKVNEIAALGDAMIGTVPPLRLRLLTDHSKPRYLNDTGAAIVTIQGGEIICGQKAITDDVDKSIAWLFMQYGEWEISGPHAIMSGQDVDALEFVWNPPERQNEGFEIVGTLSRMFARYFASETLQDGKVVQIDARTVPEWFSPLVDYKHNQDRQLPIWKFVLSPNRSNKA